MKKLFLCLILIATQIVSQTSFGMLPPHLRNRKKTEAHLPFMPPQRQRCITPSPIAEQIEVDPEPIQDLSTTQRIIAAIIQLRKERQIVMSNKIMKATTTFNANQEHVEDFIQKALIRWLAEDRRKKLRILNAKIELETILGSRTRKLETLSHSQPLPNPYCGLVVPENQSLSTYIDLIKAQRLFAQYYDAPSQRQILACRHPQCHYTCPPHEEYKMITHIIGFHLGNQELLEEINDLNNVIRILIGDDPVESPK